MEVRELNEIIVTLIRSEIKCEKLQTAVKEKLTAEIFPLIYSISKKHDVANIVADAFKSNDITVPENLKAEFTKQQNLAMLRYERMEYELTSICSLFDEKGIEYMPLKGSVIRKYYPRPYMRTSCDIDILVKKKDLKRAVFALKGELGFKNEGEHVHDVSMFSPSGVHLELHFKFCDDDVAWEKVLLNCWKHNFKYKDHICGYEMAPEYLLAYLTAHNAKHFIYGGCGIRPVADLFLLTKNMPYDGEKLNALLKECKLEKFWARQIELLEYWFGNAPASEIILKMQDYILDGGVYGTLENRMKTVVVAKENRFKFVLKRTFPSFSSMKYPFPILNKAPYLYPFLIVARWFKFFLPSKRKKAINEIKYSKTSVEERLNKQKFMDEMGL